jgi:FKBP-type peptidyl-prolyl cis-trans isomerase (trigger factor)
MLYRLSPTTSMVDGVEIVRKPELGDLVSLELHALEPVNTQHGPQYIPTQFVRGRLGQLALHPELEDAILSMQRGEVRVVPVHFGLDYPFGPYRGQRRLIRCTLIDHKPHGFAPVIEDELIVNAAGSALDSTTFPPETLELMKEVHAA